MKVKSEHSSVTGRIEREKRTVDAMIRIYCSNQHNSPANSCEQCNRLLEYAINRLDNCPFQERKPACNHCQVHCYSNSMKSEIQRVMRYSGPRMLLRHPYLSLRHFFDTFRKAPTLKKN